MRNLWRDVQHAVRVLLGRPVLTLTTVATLAIGIGGTSAMFSFANGLLLRPPPVPEPATLVRVFGASDTEALGITSFANLHDLADRATSFAALTIHQQTFVAYGLGDDTTNVAVELVSGTYFPTFRVAATLGRALNAGDDRPGADRVVVVSDRWWRSRLASDPAVVGRTISLNGTPFVVAGIAPATFRGSYDALGTDLWAPLMTYDVLRPRGLDISRRTWGWLQATARLAPGVTIDRARVEVDAIAAALRAEYPREDQGLAFSVVPAATLPESMTPGLARALAFAALVAALALLAACANVANATLATVSDRGAEIALRMALGATRGDVARQWLVESLVATTAATAIGVLLTMWLQDAALALRPLAGRDNFAPTLEVGWRVWLMASALMAVATCLAGVLPAWRAAQVDPAQPLRDGATANVGGRSSWIRPALVSAQVAVALALVALAGLLGQSVSTARGFDLGFDKTGLVLATANVSALGHDAAQSYAYHVEVIARVRALPGATEVTAAAVVPLDDNDERRGVTIDGYTPPSTTEPLSLATNVVWSGYFAMMRIPVVAGRAFADDDGRPQAPLVAIVNQTMARRYWPSGDPIGHIIRLGTKAVEVVGVVKDMASRFKTA
ncbi:MAG: ABC transporter permease [Acidobacteriota bacterium]